MKIKYQTLDAENLIINGFVEVSYWIIENKFYVTFRSEIFDENKQDIIDFISDLNGETFNIKEKFFDLPEPISKKIVSCFQDFSKKIKTFTENLSEQITKANDAVIGDLFIPKILPRMVRKLLEGRKIDLEEIGLHIAYNHFKTIFLYSIVVMASSDPESKQKLINQLTSRIFPLAPEAEKEIAKKLREWEKIIRGGFS